MVSAVPLDKNKESMRLIKTSEAKPAEWLTEVEIQGLIERDQGFIDVTYIEEYTGKPIHARKGINWCTK